MTTPSSEDADDTGIAVIGMAGRFPGAPDLPTFWQNVRNGVESVRRFTDAELLALGESPAKLRDPQYVRACPVLDDIDAFDAGFFGFSPREAAITDPQHRIFLETAWAAMENAGLVPEQYPGNVGVFATCGLNTYLMHHLVTNQELLDTVGEWLLRHMGNDMNFLATRVSYEFDLRGPSMNVQTACSSSLVAIHQAAQSLLSGECDTALAGGSTISFPLLGYLYKEGEILSADGHCRPFDARSTGTLFGSGVGVVVLRRLADARANGDTILGIVRGSAINNDGAQKMGFLAPSVDGQAGAVAEALAIAGVSPDTIDYVESHGTGTLVGDPIEVAALVQAYRASTDRKGYCGLGSLKGNIGHLGEAAGVAGFIKTILALQHRELPPSLGYETPNPAIDFGASPFYVVDQVRPWPQSEGPARAGITALGAGGTNAHVIVEEAPARPVAGPSRSSELLTISARSPQALDVATTNLAAWLRANPGVELADVAFTLQTGRRGFSHRRSLVARDAADAIALLDGADPQRIATQILPSGATREVVFMFAGGGAQYAGMGRELHDTEPAYRSVIDECLGAPDLPVGLRALMFPPPGEEEAASRKLEAPSLALPALFATELAMARLLVSFGLEATAMIGHSMGEYVAACLAGVISVQDGMRLVATRGRLFETLAAGSMLVVPLAAAEARRALPDFDTTLSIAAINAPELCVVSGPTPHVERLEQALAARGIETTRVHIAVAAHSSMLEPILRPFEEFCRTIRFSPPQKRWVSNLTGTWIREGEATDPRYWVQHLRQTVKFADGLRTIFETVAPANAVLVEVGPGRTLASLARQHPAKPAATLATLAHPKEAASATGFVLGTLGQLWGAGALASFEKLQAREIRRIVPLPSYPFERQKHWIARRPEGASAAGKESSLRRSLRKIPDVGGWYWVPSWKRSVLPPIRATSPRRLVLGAPLTGLRERWPDAEFVILDPDDRPAHDALVARLAREQKLPDQIIVLGPVGSFATDAAAVKTCFVGLLHLAQALALEEHAVEVLVVSTGLHAGTDARKALLLGPVRVIPAEIPALACRSIDLDASGSVLDRLVREADSSGSERVVAYRGTSRFVETFDALPLPTAAPSFREGGVYVITGGLGGVGLAIADHLARTFRAKLVLVSRAGLPSRDRWPDIVATDARVRAVVALETHGAEVIAGRADATDSAAMKAVLDATRARFGTIHGVIHAAGVLDDGLIQMKTAASCLRVLAPKVDGAIVLDQLLRGKDAPADFLALFSSVSAVLGLQGQIDYGAANAFLDALAASRSAREPGLTVSINWSAWRDVGMAATLAARGPSSLAHGSRTTGLRPLTPGESITAHGDLEPRRSRQPWLRDVLVETPERLVFGLDLDRDDTWLLSEHVVRGGEALVPGTGYLELAREAVAEVGGGLDGATEIRNVLFLAPFVVARGQKRPLRVGLDRASHELVIGPPSITAANEIEPHMTAQVRRIFGTPAGTISLDAIAARCPDRRTLVDGKLSQSFMAFGPRWDNVRAMSFGSGEALLELELAAAYEDDLEKQSLHPALLDMATGGAQQLVPGFDATRDFYVPFSYERVVVHRPLARRTFSHIRFSKDSTPDMPTFDVTLSDVEGNVRVAITGFVMKRLPAGASLTATPAKDVTAGPTEGISEGTEMREAAFREGMLPAEGIDAFERILAAGLGPQVIASSIDLNDWIAALGPAPALAASDAPPSSRRITTAVRPTVSTAFEAPRNDDEEAVASVWRVLLGIEQLGVHDNFFELGGHSLLLTQTVTRVRKQARIDVPLRALLTKLTVAEMAEAIAAARTTTVAQAPAIKTLSREAFRMKRSALADPAGPEAKPAAKPKEEG